MSASVKTDALISSFKQIKSIIQTKKELLMSKFYTNLSRFSSAIFATIIMLGYAFSASAEEYKSMIRYDLVCGHIYIHWNDREVYYVKFDGPEEINGKTYHKLVAFKKAKFDYDYNGHPYTFDVDDNYYEHEGYMREEDGKVYTLVAKDDDDTEYNILSLYTTDYDYPDSYKIEEKLLYDFTCKEGESYRGLQIELSDGFEQDYKVMAIEHVEIDGEDHRLLRICPDDDYDYRYGDPVVEGIGIASYGCLTTINFLLLPTCPCMGHIFNRVLSKDGRVIYRAEEDCDDIPFDVADVDILVEKPIEDNDAICDILGRRIMAPVPGQFYIQGGKKHIAK